MCVEIYKKLNPKILLKNIYTKKPERLNIGKNINKYKIKKTIELNNLLSFKLLITDLRVFPEKYKKAIAIMVKITTTGIVNIDIKHSIVLILEVIQAFIVFPGKEKRKSIPLLDSIKLNKSNGLPTYIIKGKVIKILPMFTKNIEYINFKMFSFMM